MVDEGKKESRGQSGGKSSSSSSPYILRFLDIHTSLAEQILTVRNDHTGFIASWRSSLVQRLANSLAAIDHGQLSSSDSDIS